MKINGIHINDFQQFNDFHLDLTYPKGHEKEGQPLDKVCFIGQSGTGKTTLLNIIKNLLIENHEVKSEHITYPGPNYSIDCSLDNFSFIIEQAHYFKRNVISILTNRNNDINSIIRKIKLINFPAEIVDAFKLIETNGIKDPFQTLKTKNQIDEKIIAEKENSSDKRVYDFSQDNPDDIWKAILMDADEYKVKSLRLSHKIRKAVDTDSIKATELKREIEKWQRENPNPLEVLSKVLNPVIERFYCRIKSDFDFERAEDLQFIKIETLKSKEVPYNIWSTGTKQVVLTAIPIFKLDTTNTIILIDEPERSLYPDLQLMITDFYTKLAPKAQFFFATHSPIIASSFEPWEIVELKFDYDNGTVYREKYFTGEDPHVDNYFIDPRYLRWDSVLKKVFDLKERGNELRVKKLMEIAALESKIKKASDKNKKIELYKEYKKLAELLDWEMK